MEPLHGCKSSAKLDTNFFARHDLNTFLYMPELNIRQRASHCTGTALHLCLLTIYIYIYIIRIQHE
jgi:hypothetical protein